MNKQNRGDAPKPEAVNFATGSPLNATKRQLGFEQDNIRSGNLRDHNGKTANDAGFMATKHHDGVMGDIGYAGGPDAMGAGPVAPAPAMAMGPAIPTPAPGLVGKRSI